MIPDLAALLALPFAAAIVFVGIHTYFGLHVLRRNVIFTDLALAQLSALGATLAVALGHAPGTLAGFIYAFLFTLGGAALLTASRALGRAMSQEAFIGILYVVATAATVLVVDRAPQGAEHVKRILVGAILAIGPDELLKNVTLYAAIALFHVLVRRKMREAAEGKLAGAEAALWDFLFYATFGAVVTSSVAAAGVLLVFTFLIIPAVIGTLFSARIAPALAIGWSVGLLASVVGFAASLALDLPTGAALVIAFAVVLIGAGAVRGFAFGAAAETRRRRRFAGRFALGFALVFVLAASIWSLARPGADQPLLAALEPLGLRPELFMREAEAEQYADARATELRYRAQVEALSARERETRWQGAALSEEEVRRVASYQQSYNEMGRGERFVQDHLVARARERERWWVSLPIAFLSAGALAALFLRRAVRHAARNPAALISGSTRPAHPE
jgi:zinc/manganese transport system permease protein